MIRPKLTAKTLGPISARLIEQLQRMGKNIFTIKNAMQIYGKDKFATGGLLSGLVKRGVLARIKAGIYLILQTGQENTQLRNWPIIAQEIASPHPYFISYESAMRLHGMTSHPSFYVYITLPARRQDKKISDLNYHFVYSKKEHFWGYAAHWVTKQEQVQTSDIERTILDGLDRPDLCGGLIGVVQGIWARQKEVDPIKLLRYSNKFKSKAAVKRLGFILEILGWDHNFFGQLLNVIQEARGYVLLDPDGPREGRLLNRWGLQINANTEELKASVWG